MGPRRLRTVLKEQRHKQQLTQAELAQRAGVNQSYIALLEKGDKENPSLVVLKRIAKALNVPVTTLLE